MKKAFEKHKNLIKLFFIPSIVCVLIIGSHQYRNYRHTENLLIDCFAGAAIKCGHANHTKEEILEEINFLKLTQQKARKIIEKAQIDDQKYAEKIKSKDNLTKEEELILGKIEESEKYYRRVLEVINEMESN